MRMHVITWLNGGVRKRIKMHASRWAFEDTESHTRREACKPRLSGAPALECPRQPSEVHVPGAAYFLERTRLDTPFLHSASCTRL